MAIRVFAEHINCTMIKLFVFILAVMAILNFSGCTSNGKKLGYEFPDSPIEDESTEYTEDRDTATGVVPYDNSIVDIPEFEGTSENTTLSEIYSNSKFSIRYPSNWDVVQENAQAYYATVSVQIMQQETNEYDFRPNINIIISKDKHSETTATLARMSYNKAKEIGYVTNLIGINNCKIDGREGSVVECVAMSNGYELRMYQYIVKKRDNTTFIITVTLDHNNIGDQKRLSQQIIESIKIF